MSGKTILVTGGTGYIGSHTVVELMNAGYEVVIVDNLNNSYAFVVDKIEEITGKRPAFERIDICDKSALSNFFASYQNIEAVIHFAAHKAVGESVEKPLKYYQNNVSGMLNLLEQMENHNVKHLVFSSSCTVYGQPDKLPVTENAPIKPAESPYGNTKQICEEIISDLAKTSNMQSVILRYFNPVGAHPSVKIGELPLGKPMNLMPVLTQNAIGKLKEISVFGNDYPTPDGTCIRDYIHVVDLAKAHVIAVNRLLKKNNKLQTEIFNLGTGTGYSVLEMIKTFEEVNKLKLNYKIAERRAGDVTAIYADTRFANEELGWKTELGLKEMAETAWKWEQQLEK